MIMMLEINTPRPTATIKSTNTVNSITPYMTAIPGKLTLWARWIKLQSRILKPTYTAMPASTAIGIGSVRSLATSTTNARISARMTPDNGERAPTWMLVTVPIVAPAPGNAPNRPEIMFAKPCPRSSLSESCSLRVKESPITAVNKVSIQPSVPSTKASITISVNIAGSICGTTKEGKPAGISPIRRMSSASNRITDNKVTATNATS